MSLQPQEILPVPETTARTARAAFRESTKKSGGRIWTGADMSAKGVEWVDPPTF
jgi:hypothetical protein